jgi:cyclin B
MAATADENAAMHHDGLGKVAHGKGLGVQGRRAPLGDIGNVERQFNAGVNLGKDAGGVKKAGAERVPGAAQPALGQGVLTRHQKAALEAQQQQRLAKAGREPLAALQQRQQVGAPQHVAAPAAATRVRKSMSSQLEQQSTAAQLTRRPKLAAMPDSPVPDIDSVDAADPLTAASYVSDIYAYHRRTEANFRPLPTYMARQADINDKMRAILIDWLVEVHLKFKLMPETLFLTTNLIDRFLELKGVTRKNLQLVGVTAMLIASKYEEIWAPELNDFVYISDRAYKKEQILTMEKVMLNALKFNLTVATPYIFLARFLKAAGCQGDKAVRLYSSYLTELSLPDYGMLRYSYSQIAAAAVYTAQRALGREPAYPRSLQKHSGYTLEQLQPAAHALSQLHAKAPNSSLPAVFKKYSQPKFHEVAKMPGPCAV